jgi:predicted transcriptional regulator
MPKEFVTIASSIGNAIKEWNEVDEQSLPEYLCRLLGRLEEAELASVGKKTLNIHTRSTIHPLQT